MATNVRNSLAVHGQLGAFSASPIAQNRVNADTRGFGFVFGPSQDMDQESVDAIILYGCNYSAGSLDASAKWDGYTSYGDVLLNAVTTPLAPLVGATSAVVRNGVPTGHVIDYVAEGSASNVSSQPARDSISNGIGLFTARNENNQNLGVQTLKDGALNFLKEHLGVNDTVATAILVAGLVGVGLLIVGYAARPVADIVKAVK
jgi:hypothetical protein